MARVTVGDVVERAGVSRRTFYDLFCDRDDCFLAAFEQALAYASERVIAAYGADGQWSWRERVRAGLIALLCFLDEEPVVGRVLIVESARAAGAALERRSAVIGKLTSAIEAGARESKAGSVPALTGEGVVGGVLAVIQSRLAERDHGRLVELTGPLMNMVVLPYLGQGAARRELERPAPRAAPRQQTVALPADPFKEVGMRVTYRTVRVLLAIEELTARGVESSNRQVGAMAEIGDQGQISKLLSRLERIGLIANMHLHPGKGAPNSWALTEKGRCVAHGIRAHAGSEGVAA